MAKKKDVRISVIFDRKCEVSSTGIGRIEAVVSFPPSVRRYVVLGTSSLAAWKVKVQSMEMQKHISEIVSIIEDMKANGEAMTKDVFNIHYEHFKKEKAKKKAVTPAVVYNGVDQSASLPDFIEQEIASESTSRGTKLHKMTVVYQLRDFGGLNTFADITNANIIAFDKWLHQRGRDCDASIYDKHKRLHMYIRKLRAAEMIPKDPYCEVKFNRGSFKERKPLTEQELTTIREIKLTSKLDKARDLFVFSAYTGLAYVDVMNFDYSTMTVEKSGLTYIDGKRIKTRNSFFTPILEPAMAVLRKYDFHLPTMSNQKANDYLHVIQERLGISKDITFHVARHSFATLCLSHDVPIEDVARMLGHRDIKTTQIYAKVLTSTIERHASSLNDAIK